MAYVITAVGAGGKTTYLNQRAQECLRQGLRTALTTTTHIWPVIPEGAAGRSVRREERSAVLKISAPGYPDVFGIQGPSGRLSAPEPETYEELCRTYDVVLVEGDGSHCMPVKIPSEYEPVIPENTDEIAVLMGSHAVGRRIDVVCHRYAGESRQRVTEEMLAQIAERYYLAPLRVRYPEAKLSYVLSRMPVSPDRIAGVLMASGFGRRYGGNKLLDLYQEKPLYRHALDHVTQALGAENVTVVTQYDRILEETGSMGIDALRNDMASEGIAASICLGTQRVLERGADIVMFFAADMPSLPAEEIRMFAEQFAGSGKTCGCMEFGKEHICTNPGAFRLKESAEKLLRLTGDRGAMRIMRQEPWNIYYYQIAPEWAQDVDEKETAR